MCHILIDDQRHWIRNTIEYKGDLFPAATGKNNRVIPFLDVFYAIAKCFLSVTASGGLTKIIQKPYTDFS
jgi:hypothetical protein